MGNPLSYKGRTLTWQGRRLISYGIENKKATYSYDFNNVRTSKIATDGTTSVTSKYIYDGNNLIAEQRTVKGPDKDKSVWLYYIYGVDGIAGFNFEDKVYLYRKNVQGDITHIYRKDGNKDLVEVAHYAYDAYGNTEILSETDKIGSLNPFRYRGYYFDIETKLYYLISRYYDPETCRFISADSIEYLDPETLGGLNLYAYCCNNPVMNVDPTGEAFLSFLILSIIIGAVVGGAINTYKAYNEGASGWGLVGAFAGGAILGGAMGAVMAIGGAAGLASLGIATTVVGGSTLAACGISIGIGITASFAAYTIETLSRTDKEWNWSNFFISGFTGGVQAISTFWIAFAGGRAGLFNKPLTKMGSEDFLQYVVNKFSKVSLSQSFVYGSNILISNFFARFLLCTIPGAGTRWLIEKIIKG